MDFPGDVYIRGHVQPESVRRALATSLGLPLAHVGIRRPGSPYPVDVEAIAAPWIEDLPGDWPCDYWLVMPEWSLDRVADVLGTLAVELGLPLMTGADAEDPFIMDLYLPDGSMHQVPFLQDDDGGFRDTPEITRLIASATAGITSAATMRLAS